MKRTEHHSFHLFHPTVLITAAYRAFVKCNPFSLFRNPVIFVTEIGAILVTFDALGVIGSHHDMSALTSFWLWITVFIANFAEALAELRNEAQAESLKSMRTRMLANRYGIDGNLTVVNYHELRKGDTILIRAGESIPADGEIISGTATIDESSVTGESQPVIRKSGTEQGSVLAGTKVLSDQIIVKVSSNPGEGSLDKMIELIEGAQKKKTHNELALTILLSGLGLIFIIIISTMIPFGYYYHATFYYANVIAFLVCLMPTTIAGLLSSIGIAGINRLMKANVIAMSGQAVEKAGDIDVILIDKTGTITFGNRHAYSLYPYQAGDVHSEESVARLIKACYYTSYLDSTAEGKSVIELLEEKYPHLQHQPLENSEFVPFSATTRLSGLDAQEQYYRKGAVDAIEAFTGKRLNLDMEAVAKRFSEQGGTPLAIAEGEEILGLILLKDKIKPGLPELFRRFRLIGIKTIMITGDNPVTAESIAAEVGVDDFLASATPEQKLQYIKKLQEDGHFVAMTGDGVNDAPALAHADLGVAMNSGAQAAKEAGNMIDLDSHPIKLFQIIEIGKQILMTRGALTTFSIATDVAKYFAILQAILIPAFPLLKKLNFLQLHSNNSAILSAVIFNALIIVLLIPLAFRGVKLVPRKLSRTLNWNLAIYGLGGIIFPFIGIKAIDMAIAALKILE
ncbi:MAG: potassium-transporting ATPase subunit KdpB [Verrucomicrobia bacterium]|nr:potassium-transporting ATPase subunit KdpB [Verrucomicrobiota bacterium]